MSDPEGNNFGGVMRREATFQWSKCDWLLKTLKNSIKIPRINLEKGREVTGIQNLGKEVSILNAIEKS